MRVSRRRFLKYITMAAAAVVTSCTRLLNRDELRVTVPSEPGPFAIIGEPDRIIEATPGRTVSLKWSSSATATSYDLEINGVIVAEGLGVTQLDLGQGNGGVALQEGLNTYRVRARNDIGELWSDPGRFEMRVKGGIRARHFDFEDDGEIDLTVASSGTVLTVGAQFAYGAGGKGVALRCSDPVDSRAYKNLRQLPVTESWIRLAIRPVAWDADEAEVRIARVRSDSDSASEYLIWRTGAGLSATSVDAEYPVPAGEWSQAQLGVMEDGSVELWVFDGRREFLVGLGRNEGLEGRNKDVISIGNDSPHLGITYEVWLDELVVGRQKLPWARSDDEHPLLRPKPLDVSRLGTEFSFVFGSCNVSSRVPYKGTALEAAASSDADFVIHLGDYCYPDSGAYKQSINGYKAIWSDLSYEECLDRLFRKPWIYVASDHDVGGNNVDRETLSPHALAAYTSWHENDRTTDDGGRYGVHYFDEGRVALVWVDAISMRSPVSAPDDEDKTALGFRQKAWLLDLLASSPAKLVMIASQTSFAHESDSGWALYPRERLEILEASRMARARVRLLSGDHHSARWAVMGGDVVEWGAAPFAEIPQVCAPAADFVTDSICSSRLSLTTSGRPLRRRQILATLSDDEIAADTSYGMVSIDTVAKLAKFEVRDSGGQVRRDETGRSLSETIRYA